MNGYELSRSWFDFSFNNPELIKPTHTAIYFFAIEHCNRLGWKEKFGLPTTMAKEALGIKSYNTYINALHDLVDWGFIIMVEKSKNQHSANIVALSNFNKAHDKALDKAMIKHALKQRESTSESNCTIDKQLTINKEQKNVQGMYKLIIDYLNLKTECNYKHTTATTTTFIKARAAEGFTVDQFKKVIDVKTAEWKGTEQEKYLRPQTLFGTKFESYLNQKSTNTPDDSKRKAFEASLAEARKDPRFNEARW